MVRISSSLLLLCLCLGLSSAFLGDLPIQCNRNARFRTYDGSCNNLGRPEWGKIFTMFRRALPAEYGDRSGNTPRNTSVTGAPLPNPRTVSLNIHSAISHLQPDLNVMLMQWGQFLDHDITHAPQMTSDTPCCSDSRLLTLNYTHPDYTKGKPCAPIVIPEPDPYFNTPETRCMEFKRSRGVFDRQGVRQQLNELTPWVDASHIYGVTRDLADSLRTFQNGKLKSKTVSGKDFLPEWDVEGTCFKQVEGDYCFKAGDIRVNVYPGLTALHTVFLRYHNKLCDRLHATNPRWSDERLYQEARKIVGAIMQKVSYDEFLPIILGRDSAEKYNLLSGDTKYRYNRTLEPTLSNAFSGAAYRYGHSAIPDALTIDGKRILTGDLYMRPRITLDHLDGVVKALVSQPQEKVDQFYSLGISNRLFEPPNKKGHGFDLAILNVQRGRDHGLPPYPKWRTACGLSEVKNFYQLYQGDRFQDTYASVDDIDLYSGGLSEVPTKGAWVGPVFHCILREQFKTLKFADRFWYENPDDPTTSLTSSQINEIRNTNLATILCATTDIKDIQPNVFRAPVGDNVEKPCSTYKDINVESHWLERTFGTGHFYLLGK